MQAVEAWRDGEWDLILMDVQMPEMDGPTATQEIRRSEATTARLRTPIFALSANAMPHQIADYLKAGMDGHIAKPIQVRDLFAVLDRVAASHAPPSPSFDGRSVVAGPGDLVTDRAAGAAGPRWRS